MKKREKYFTVCVAHHPSLDCAASMSAMSYNYCFPLENRVALLLKTEL